MKTLIQNLKNLFFALLILNSIYCIDVDGIINGKMNIIYSRQPAKSSEIYEIKINDGRYFEIINYYGNLTILKNNDILYTDEYSKEEKAFYFKYDDYSKYYLIFEVPSPFITSGFSVESKTLPYDNIIEDSVKLKLLTERKFELKIENENQSPQLIYINIPTTYRISVNDDAEFEEDGKSFKPIIEKESIYGYYSYYYYAILNKYLIFKFTLQTKWYSTKDSECYADIYVVKNVSKEINKKSYFKEGSIKYYKLNFTDSSECEISIRKNTKLFLIKNNFDEPAEIIGTTTIQKTEPAFLFLESGCFSVIFQKEKKITEYGIIELYLFDSRSFTLTFINTKTKYISVSSDANSFDLVDVYLHNKNDKIYDYSEKGGDISYYISKTNEETVITFKFEQKNNIYFGPSIVRLIYLEFTPYKKSILVKIGYISFGICGFLFIIFFIYYCCDKSEKEYYYKEKLKAIYLFKSIQN